METSQLLTLRLADFFALLRERGRYEEALNYEIIALTFDDDPYDLTVEEFIEMLNRPPTPPEYAGWNFLWGEHFLRSNP